MLYSSSMTQVGAHYLIMQLSACALGLVLWVWRLLLLPVIEKARALLGVLSSCGDGHERYRAQDTRAQTLVSIGRRIQLRNGKDRVGIGWRGMVNISNGQLPSSSRGIHGRIYLSCQVLG